MKKADREAQEIKRKSLLHQVHLELNRAQLLAFWSNDYQIRQYITTAYITPDWKYSLCADLWPAFKSRGDTSMHSRHTNRTVQFPKPTWEVCLMPHDIALCHCEGDRLGSSLPHPRSCNIHRYPGAFRRNRGWREAFPRPQQQAVSDTIM